MKQITNLLSIMIVALILTACGSAGTNGSPEKDGEKLGKLDCQIEQLEEMLYFDNPSPEEARELERQIAELERKIEKLEDELDKKYAGNASAEAKLEAAYLKVVNNCE